jgi:hypothetical protein
MRLFSAFLTVAGCLHGGRCDAALPQSTLGPLPQSTLAALPAPAACPCPCSCGTTGVCTCAPGQCRCAACPGQGTATLDGLKARAMAENKRLVVWTGTPGHNIPDCLACRDERFRAVSLPRPFVSVGVPSATGLIWWQFAASVPDALLQTVRTDGTHDAAVPAVTAPAIVTYQPTYAMQTAFRQSFGGGCGG